MTGNYTAELWRPLSCCLWPYWMSHSQGTQSPFRAWINGSWLDFGGLLCCFCLLWHLPSLCEISVLLPDKGTTSSDGGREKWGDRNWGRGIVERDRQGCFLSFLVVLRFAVLLRAGVKCKHLCFHISIFVCLWPCDSKAFAVMEHNLWNMYQQRVRVSGLKWNLINFFSVCLFLDVSASISPHFVPTTPLYSAEESGN